ncbi:TetR/AcrR family transcriptional regulator [Georgenia sp. Z1344]|uniref:TetR/AcrR family transcriptional regulator n=1 Tax=Georgenia sp. Z1344 TaxID=3416706 RepID=UPI003CEF87E9
MHTIDLLWRGERPLPARPGRRPRIGVDDVVAAGVAEADERGLDGLSVRGVAGRLGVGVMTLYGHVTDRAQLVELMVDDCRARHARRPLAGSWRDMLEQVAAENLALMTEHPWLAHVETERAVLGPGTLGAYEHELAALEPLGLDDVARDRALALVLGHVRGAARAMAAARVENAEESTAQWWEREGARLAELGVEERFPLASRVGAAAGEAQGAAADARSAYEFGLAVILDGLAAAAGSRGA